jgi:hypothetical protein
LDSERKCFKNLEVKKLLLKKHRKAIKEALRVGRI